MAEAIERTSGLFRGDEPRVAASLNDLGPAGVDPNRCMRFSRQQYRNRIAWNRQHGRVNWVPRVLDESSRIDWTPLRSLTREGPKYLPTSYCYYGYPETPKRLYCLADSNGCAAGNTLHEAILRGLLEVIERDSVAIWWYNRLSRPAIDLGRFDDSLVSRMREHVRSLGRDLRILDLTSDLGIPVVAAISRRAVNSDGTLLLGFGAHFSTQLAIRRALVELGQVLAVAASMGLEQIGFSSSPADLDWLEAEGHDPAPEPEDKSEKPDDPPGLVGWCAELLERHGLEVLALDQTRPELGMRVVKVIVPGLRPWWARFGSGRLYEVPVRCGWLEQSLEECELNPTHLYL